MKKFVILHETNKYLSRIQGCDSLHLSNKWDDMVKCSTEESAERIRMDLGNRERYTVIAITKSKFLHAQ